MAMSMPCLFLLARLTAANAALIAASSMISAVKASTFVLGDSVSMLAFVASSADSVRPVIPIADAPALAKA
jgi:hypothetical protein